MKKETNFPPPPAGFYGISEGKIYLLWKSFPVPEEFISGEVFSDTGIVSKNFVLENKKTDGSP
ncbi:TPA: hypothetical protein DIC38_03185 [Candidatus Nomurabacteria bacterium]|nr:MAG: hypothetical protein O210_OD1C00001G0146 [Parcubacteria bacterium RAAC4_OD1_1]HCY26656.1 hypothetical protein [Candidatus Nomurabacteria bacterium]